MSTLKTARLVAAVLAVAACAKKDGAATDSAATRVDSTTTAAAATTDSAAGAVANTTNTAWMPANVLGFAHASNTGEIALSKLGETKGTSASVKSFARQMIADHQAMDAEGKKLGDKLSAMPDTTTGDAANMMKDGQDKLQDLTNKAAGSDWDKDFMQAQIDAHQKTLDKLQDAQKNVTDADVKAMLDKAIPKVQSHLDKAKSVKDALK